KRKEVNISITGMTCAACANRVERGLKKMDGVENATVNLALEKSTITFNPDEVNVQDFEKKIEDLGYGVVREKKEFVITGMTCAACSSRIEKVLQKMPGVSNATVNLALENATVEFNPSELSATDIINRVKKLGYGAQIKENEQEALDYREQEIKKQTRKFIISAILSLPLLWTMVGHFPFTSFIYMPDLLMNPWVQMALATPLQFIVGWQFYSSAYKALKNGSANMDVLVVLDRKSTRLNSSHVKISYAVFCLKKKNI